MCSDARDGSSMALQLGFFELWVRAAVGLKFRLVFGATRLVQSSFQVERVLFRLAPTSVVNMGLLGACQMESAPLFPK